MRITTKMITNRYLQDATNNMNNLQKINNQMTTGKEIGKPSDNPYKVARSMQLNTDVNSNTQYNTNISDTINWLDTTDQYLGQASDVVSRIRSLMVSAGNAAYGSDERKAISDEVNQRVEELGQILNSNFDGKYVFGGTKTDSTPLLVQKDSNGNKFLAFASRNGGVVTASSTGTDGDDYQMLGSDLKTEISQGVTINYNVNARDILDFTVDSTTTPATNVSDLLKNISSNLSGFSPTGGAADNTLITGTYLDQIDKALANIQTCRSEVGAKQNRMDSAKTNNEDASNNMTAILSKTEDIDIAQKTIEYSTAQTVYQATLQVSAQILPRTLLDYLR